MEIRAGNILEDTVLRPGDPWGRQLQKGQRLRIVDLHGKQAVDFMCFDAANPRNRYNAANTMKLAASVFIEQGAQLVSDDAQALFTVVEDSCASRPVL